MSLFKHTSSLFVHLLSMDNGERFSVFCRRVTVLLKSGIQVENITKAIRISQPECDGGTRAQDQGSLSGEQVYYTH